MEGLAKAADNEVRAKTRPKKVVFETQQGEEKVAVYSVRHKDLEMIAEVNSLLCVVKSEKFI